MVPRLLQVPRAVALFVLLIAAEEVPRRPSPGCLGKGFHARHDPVLARVEITTGPRAWPFDWNDSRHFRVFSYERRFDPDSRDRFPGDELPNVSECGQEFGQALADSGTAVVTLVEE